MAYSINPSSKRYRRDASFSDSLRIVSLQERPTAVSLSSRGMICTIPPTGVLMAKTFFMYRLTCLLFPDRTVQPILEPDSVVNEVGEASRSASHRIGRGIHLQCR